MKICLATGELLPTPGGIATYTHNLATLLTRGDHQVTVLTSGEQPGGFDPGYSVVSLAEEAHSERDQLQQTWGYYPPSVHRHLSAGLAMRGWLDANADRYAFDVIEVPEFGGYGAMLTDLDLPPLAATYHGSYGQMRHYQGIRNPGPKYRVLVGLESQLMTLADALSAYSPMNALAWTGVLGRDVQFVLAPWLPDTETFAGSPAQAAAEIPVTGVVVGRLQDWKGALEMIAAADVCRKRGVPVRIRWIGGDTTSAPDGGSMADYLALHYPDVWNTTFAWTGSLDRKQTRSEQANAGFAVIPSRWDTLNFTALEAMSVGTPVVVSTGAGASYLIRDGENGLTVPPLDGARLADALQRIATEPKLRHEMGQAAQRTIHDEFDPDGIVTKRIRWYETAIAQRQTRRDLPFLAQASNLVPELLTRRPRTSMSRVPRALAGRLKRSISHLDGGR